MSVHIGDSAVQFNPNAQQAPEADSEGEAIARAAAEAARKVAQQKQQVATQAMRVAAQANRRAQQAETMLKSKVALLQEKGAEMPPDERAQLESELNQMTDLVGQLKDAAAEANSAAGEARAEARAAEDKRIDVEQTANRVLKALGKGEPFSAQKAIEDVFVFELISVKLAKMLGNPKLPSPRAAAAQDGRRMASALQAGLANGAYVLEQAVEGNADPLYREGLLEDVAGHVGQLGFELGGGGDELGALFDDQQSREALASLARTAELLGPDGAKRLAEAFVAGALNGQAKMKDPSILGLRLKDALASNQSGATFALEVALAFAGKGDFEAASEALNALCQALKEARERFDQMARMADGLDSELTKFLGSPEVWQDQETLLNGVLGFEDHNLPKYVDYEQAAAALAAMLAGAGHVLVRAKEGKLPQLDICAELLMQAKLALGRTDRLATSAAGQQRLTESLDAQGRGEKTFLNLLPEVAAELERAPQQGVQGADRFERGKQSFLDEVGLGIAQHIAPQVLALKTGSRLEELNKMLKTVVGQNPAFFGITAMQTARVGVIFSGMIHAKRPNTLRDAMANFTKLGNVALKSLALVMAGACAATSSYGHGEELTQALRDSAAKLKLGRGGLGLVASMLRRPPAMPAMAGIVALVGTSLLYNVGTVTTKVADAFSGLAGGVSGNAAFAADSDFLTAIGAMLSSISGARLSETIAAAALKAKPMPRTVRAANAKPSEDVASLKAYLRAA